MGHDLEERRIEGCRKRYKDYYVLEKDGATYKFFEQSAFNNYLQRYENRVIDTRVRKLIPDYAVLIERPTPDGSGVISEYLIFEVKNQNVAGTVEQKIGAGPAFRDAYRAVLGTEKVWFSFCFSSWFHTRFNPPPDADGNPVRDHLFECFEAIFEAEDIGMFFPEDTEDDVYLRQVGDWIFEN
jgi:hypothetical protein